MCGIFGRVTIGRPLDLTLCQEQAELAARLPQWRFLVLSA